MCEREGFRMRARFGLVAAGCVLLAGCAHVEQTTTGGDPVRGAAAIVRYGCGTCHTIGGISNARGLAGPPLTGIGSRIYVAGVLQNTPENLIRWIRHPKEVDEKTVMPDLGLSQEDATDIAAYLYTLK